MRISNNYHLRKWLAREVLGREIPRKPPERERKGPPRDADYRAWIGTLPCCACGSERNVEAAHTGSDGGTSQKASDYSCVPLCRECHTMGPRAYHGPGSSAPDFARRHGLDFPRLVCRLNRAWRAMRAGAA